MAFSYHGILSSPKRNEIHVKTLMNLNSFMLSKKSDTKDYILHDFNYMECPEKEIYTKRKNAGVLEVEIDCQEAQGIWQVGRWGLMEVF